MPKRISALTGRFAVYFLVGCVSLFARATTLTNGWESYFARPEILTVEARDAALGSEWETIKAAHFDFVATLLEFYPNQELYFLARDSEHLYDVARLATNGSAEATRIHLLNVSRANMRDAAIKDYLSENGISERTLRAGKQVVFIDTGFAGTIPRTLAENYSQEARTNLQTHLIASSNPNHPSSRVFLAHLNPLVNELDPAMLHGTIIGYEQMPRYTDRSTGFVDLDGRLHPISPASQANDGTVSKREALTHMQDIKAEWAKEATRARFRATRRHAREVLRQLTIARENSASKTQVATALKSKLARLDASERIHFEALLRDAIELQAKRGERQGLTLDDLSLRSVSREPSDGPSKKELLLQAKPEWATHLTNPEIGIRELFKNGDWQTIGALFDADVDDEINRQLIKSLYDGQASGTKRRLQHAIIVGAGPQLLASIAQYGFSQPNALTMQDLLRKIIERSERLTIDKLAVFVFSKQEAFEMQDLLRLLIERHSDPWTLQLLTQFVFSKPHGLQMTESLRFVIERADQATLQDMVLNTFTNPKDARTRSLLRLLIERADGQTLDYVGRYALSMPHANTPEDTILKASLSIPDADVRKSFLRERLDVDDTRPTSRAPRSCRAIFE